jgi:hypothetical protein
MGAHLLWMLVLSLVLLRPGRLGAGAAPLRRVA